MHRVQSVIYGLLLCSLGSIPVMSNAALDVMEYQGISYVTGGIGIDERTELEAMATDFSLKLVFAVKSAGNYLSDVRVTIQDQQGSMVLDTISKGPWLYAGLKPGQYTVTATAADEELRQQVQVHEGRQSELIFYFSS